MAKSGISSNALTGIDFSETIIGIVKTEWNTHIIDRMYQSCISTLSENGVSHENIISIEVPGAFEIPFGIKLLLDNHKIKAAIGLGCVIKGETSHDQHINRAVSSALMQLSIFSNVPVIFGVLTTNDEAQAMARSGGDNGNKGADAAITALKMVALKSTYNAQKKKIGY